jgi:hypothetical protein
MRLPIDVVRRSPCRLTGLSTVLAMSLAPTIHAAAPPAWHNAELDPVWQWSVPAPTIPDRRAFLWVDPACTHVRGIVVGLQNMLEEPLFERVAFRRACAANGLAILMVYSGHDRAAGDERAPAHAPRSYLDIFLNPDFAEGSENAKLAGEDLQRLLDRLARESGYPEVARAPLLPVGHSSAGSFVWHLYRWDPGRIFAMLPYKTGLKSDGPAGIPILDVNSEWFDYGKSTVNVSTKPTDFRAEQAVRAKDPNALFGMYVDVGAGHCDVSDDSAAVVSLFLKTAVVERIPAETPDGQPVKLNPIDVATGWLIAPADLGKAGVRPVAYADWKGDPAQALWYASRELAEAVQDHMVAQYAKRPQQLNFVRDDGTVPTTGGTFNFSPKFIDDQGTFRLEARYIDELQAPDVYPAGTQLGHGDQPILYRVNSGCVRQVGPDTFRVVPHPGPLIPQGNPWEPTLVAYVRGDDRFRPTERPAHAFVNVVNRSGAAQTIDFPAVPNRSADDPSPTRLTATASSGLPVQYDVISGPVRLGDDGGSLEPATLPPHLRTPARVLVSAFQWGRPSGTKVQSAGPVVRQFWVVRPGDVLPADGAEAPAPPAAR